MKLSQRLAADNGDARGARGARDREPVGVLVNARRAPRPPAPRSEPPRRARSASTTPVAATSVDELRIAVRDGVIDEVGPRLADGAIDEGHLQALVEKQLVRALRTSTVTISPAERREFVEATLADMVGWGVLTPLMADPSVTEVMCNGPDRI